MSKNTALSLFIVTTALAVCLTGCGSNVDESPKPSVKLSSEPNLDPLVLAGKLLLTVPAAPANLTAQRTYNRVELKWQDRSDNETEMILCQGWSDVVMCGISPQNTTTATLNVTANWTYEFKVQACNSSGCSEFSNVIIMPTPASVCPPPTLHAEILSPLAVRLSWENPANDILSTELDRVCGNEGLDVFSDGIPGGCLNPFQVDDMVSPGRTYTYRLRLLSMSLGLSDWSEPLTVSVPLEPVVDLTPPTAPTILDVYASPLFIWLGWGGASDNDEISYYKIRLSGGPPNATPQSWEFPAYSEYITINGSGHYGPNVNIDYRPGVYAISVRAVDRHGNESPAIEKTVTIPTWGGSGVCGPVCQTKRLPFWVPDRTMSEELN
ncbi:MAG: chitinase N-terminal domain-containing protein [Pseudomonadota bacterium]